MPEQVPYEFICKQIQEINDSQLTDDERATILSKRLRERIAGRKEDIVEFINNPTLDGFVVVRSRYGTGMIQSAPCIQTNAFPAFSKDAKGCCDLCP